MEHCVLADEDDWSKYKTPEDDPRDDGVIYYYDYWSEQQKKPKGDSVDKVGPAPSKAPTPRILPDPKEVFDEDCVNLDEDDWSKYPVVPGSEYAE